MKNLAAIFVGSSFVVACGQGVSADAERVAEASPTTKAWAPNQSQIGIGTGTGQNCAANPASCYVRVEGSHLSLAGKPYRYMGTNLWSAPFISRARLKSELDALQGYGIKNLRVMAISEGGLTAAEENDQQFGPQRIVPASSDAPCEDSRLDAFIETLRGALDEIDAHGMKAVLTLNNFWNWSGGMAQYMKWAHEQPGTTCGKDYAGYIVNGIKDPVTHASLLTADAHVPFQGSPLFKTGAGDTCEAIPLHDFVIPHPITIPPNPNDKTNWWQEVEDLSSMFFCNAKAQEFFFSRVDTLVRKLADHPGIMAWQLANEPRSFKGWNTIYERWVEHTARFIKERDPHHIISIGSEGDLYQWGDYANSNYEAAHSVPGIDYMTTHVWPENWGWYDAKSAPDATDWGSLSKAMELSKSFIEVQVGHAKNVKKPLVLEEFGLARDARSFDPASPVTQRDKYYAFMFQQVVDHPEFDGVNAWAWGGVGRPAGHANRLWRLGDDYIGDPPHEEQGWYSVYSTDTATLQLIGDFARRIDEGG